MIKVSDYIINSLANAGIRHVFTVSGGGIMHLIDSLGKSDKLEYICNYHEQACAIAAESYARTTEGLGACLVTTGPGGANAIPGIAGAWVDSIPVIVICGQVRRDLIANYAKERQRGPQEINIEAMARPITKFVTTLTDAKDVRKCIEKALHIAQHGRPGPVWINIPLDVQGEMVDETQLTPYIPDTTFIEKAFDPICIDQIVDSLKNSKRPALIGGNGIYLSKARESFRELADTLSIPVLHTIGAMDLLPEAHPCNMGRFGPLGQRRANFTVQNADLLIAIGTSLSVSTVGFNTDSFAPGARKIMINIDQAELDKARPAPDISIAADAGLIIEKLLAALECYTPPQEWQIACAKWREKYPVVTPEHLIDSGYVNSYVFVNTLSRHLAIDDTIVTGNSLDIWSCYHSFETQKRQRLYTNINFGSMGWDLPGAVGACAANHPGRTVLITGDGSILFSLHELQTIGHHQFNLKIFVLNNGGYDSIRTTQTTHFAGHLVGSDIKSGISNPDYENVAKAFNIKYFKIENNGEIASKLSAILAEDGPTFCELRISYSQGRSPKVISYRDKDGVMKSGTLENMFPFLPESEIEENMKFSSADSKKKR